MPGDIGQFETHITVRAENPESVERLQRWAEQREIRFHHIELDRGASPIQPMLTVRSSGVLAEQLPAAIAIRNRLHSEGFTVARIKIEVEPNFPDVPQTDEAASLAPGCYFESHIKLLLEPTIDVSSLTELVMRHSARLSRNARRVRSDGRTERFVTSRYYAVGRILANLRTQELVTMLRTSGYDVMSVEEEYVVYDDAPEIDAGWLTL